VLTILQIVVPKSANIKPGLLGVIWKCIRVPVFGTQCFGLMN